MSAALVKVNRVLISIWSMLESNASVCNHRVLTFWEKRVRAAARSPKSASR